MHRIMYCWVFGRFCAKSCCKPMKVELPQIWLPGLDWLKNLFQELLSSSPSLKEPKVCISCAVICSYFFLVNPIPISVSIKNRTVNNRWSKPTYLRCHYKTPNLGCPKPSIIFRLVSQFSWQNMWSSTLYCRRIWNEITSWTGGFGSDQIPQTVPAMLLIN